MEFKRLKTFYCLGIIAALLCLPATLTSAAELGFYKQGGLNLNGPEYGWWYGCTATSAGMMMGYYDQKGYGGLSYANLVPGVVAENYTQYRSVSPYETRSALVHDVIASQAHVNDYYSGDNTGGFIAYGTAGDDVPTPTHANNCLADFMGTNQDATGNANGSTTIYYWTDGAKFTARDAFTYGVSNQDGMYGIDEYFRYAGYGSGDITTDESFFTQRIYSTSSPYGFTFTDYKAAIDDGRVVMIQVSGHSMFGYGYTDDGQIIFDDTWNGHNLTMAWGGYYGDMQMWGVTCFTPSGGNAITPTPLPSSLLLLGPALFGLLASRMRSKN